MKMNHTSVDWENKAKQSQSQNRIQKLALSEVEGTEDRHIKLERRRLK